MRQASRDGRYSSKDLQLHLGSYRLLLSCPHYARMAILGAILQNTNNTETMHYDSISIAPNCLRSRFIQTLSAEAKHHFEAP